MLRYSLYISLLVALSTCAQTPSPDYYPGDSGGGNRARRVTPVLTHSLVDAVESLEDSNETWRKATADRDEYCRMRRSDYFLYFLGRHEKQCVSGALAIIMKDVSLRTYRRMTARHFVHPKEESPWYPISQDGCLKSLQHVVKWRPGQNVDKYLNNLDRATQHCLRDFSHPLRPKIKPRDNPFCTAVYCLPREPTVGLLPRTHRLTPKQNHKLVGIIDRMWGMSALPYAQMVWLIAHGQPLTAEMKEVAEDSRTHLRRAFDYPKINPRAYNWYKDTKFSFRPPVHTEDLPKIRILRRRKTGDFFLWWYR